MRQHPRRRNGVARLDAAAQSGHRRDLAFWKIGIAVIVAGIGDLDADRARINVGLARPEGSAGMPGAASFLHQLEDAAVLEHKVMRRHFARGRAQSVQRLGGVRHPGVVEQNHVGALAALAIAVIGRGPDFGNDAGLGGKHTERHGLNIRTRRLADKPICACKQSRREKNKAHCTDAMDVAWRVSHTDPPCSAVGPPRQPIWLRQ